MSFRPSIHFNYRIYFQHNTLHTYKRTKTEYIHVYLSIEFYYDQKYEIFYTL